MNDITGRARIMLAMATNEAGSWVHAALPEAKQAVAALEKKGLVTVRRTNDRCDGHLEWWFRLAQ